jgi:hypothetical protein
METKGNNKRCELVWGRNHASCFVYLRKKGRNHALFTYETPKSSCFVYLRNAEKTWVATSRSAGVMEPWIVRELIPREISARSETRE